jgi:hypothetical protein
MPRDERTHVEGDTVDERGVTLSADGRDRARARLREMDERMTPERWDALRARLGVDAA